MDNASPVVPVNPRERGFLSYLGSIGESLRALGLGVAGSLAGDLRSTHKLVTEGHIGRDGRWHGPEGHEVLAAGDQLAGDVARWAAPESELGQDLTEGSAKALAPLGEAYDWANSKLGRTLGPTGAALVMSGLDVVGPDEVVRLSRGARALLRGGKVWKHASGHIPRAWTRERAKWDADYLARQRDYFGDVAEDITDVRVEDVVPSHDVTDSYHKGDLYEAMAYAGELPPAVGYMEGGKVHLLDGNGRYAGAKRAGRGTFGVRLVPGPKAGSRTVASHATVDPDPFGTGSDLPRSGSRRAPRREAAKDVSAPVEPTPVSAEEFARMEGVTDPATIAALKAETTVDPGALFEAWNKNGGFTFQPGSGKYLGPDSGGGYAVGMYPKLSKTIGAAEASPEAIAEFARANAATLAESPLNTLGAWKSPDGNLVLDVSRVFPEEAAAREAGVARGERAIFDLGKLQDVSLEDEYLRRMTPDQVAGSTFREWTPGSPTPEIPMGQLQELLRTNPEKRTAFATHGGHWLPKKDGTFTGAPKHITSREQADAILRRNVDNLIPYPWYDKMRAYLRKADPFGGDRGAYTAAVMSNQASPGDEHMRNSVQRLAYVLQGPGEGAKKTIPMFQTQAEAVDALMRGASPDEVEALGFKTRSYGDSLAGRDNLGANDRHQATAHGFPGGEGIPGKTEGLGDAEHAWLTSQGLVETEMVKERMARDPAFRTRWTEAYGDDVVVPERVQESIWFVEKARKTAAKLGVTLEEALEIELKKPLNRQSATGELIALEEKGINPAWKSGDVDTFLGRLGALQHPDARPDVARPTWAPESFADPHNTRAAAYGDLSDKEQRALMASKGEMDIAKGGKRKGLPKLDDDGNPVGRKLTREEILERGGLDQEAGLQALASLRQYAEGRRHGELLTPPRAGGTQRRIPVDLPELGGGRATRALMSTLEQFPGLEQTVGADAFAATANMTPATRPVEKARALLREGGVRGLADHVRRYGTAGLPGILAAIAASDKE